MAGTFSSRHILITGATGGGVGTALARDLRARGAEVYINARGRASVQEFIDREPNASNFHNVGGDISIVGGVDEIVSGCGGQIDTIIFNAAPSHARSDIHDYQLEQWNDEIATIMTGTLLLCQAFLPAMVRRKFGRIVAISSNAAARGTWGRGVGYVAAKAGIEGLVRQVALEYGPHGITANSIAPSQIDTPRARRAGRKSDEDFANYAEALVPAKRVGRPDDICALARFLISGEAAYLNGQTIALDGGSALSTRFSLASGEGS